MIDNKIADKITSTSWALTKIIADSFSCETEDIRVDAEIPKEIDIPKKNAKNITQHNI